MSSSARRFAPVADRFGMNVAGCASPTSVPASRCSPRSSRTASPTCSAAGAPANCRPRSSPWSATTRTTPRWPQFHGVPFHHLPVTAGDAGPSRRPPCSRLLRRLRRRTGGARPLHADPRPARARRLPEPDHQHPPLVPARVRRRPPVPPGPAARREADRRDRALRHRRPRRGADHRAGRRRRSATATRSRTWSARAATWRPWCSPARCARTSSTARSSSATRPSCSGEQRGCVALDQGGREVISGTGR